MECNIFRQFARGFENTAETPLANVMKIMAQRPDLHVDETTFKAAMKQAKIKTLTGRFGEALDGPRILAICRVLDASVDAKREDEATLANIDGMHAADQTVGWIKHNNAIFRERAEREEALEQLATKKAAASA